MNFSFDLISDLHIETWQDFDLTNRATSPVCVVAGDVARDHESLRNTLQHLSRCYNTVFYIDGNEEHKNNWYDLDSNYSNIAETMADLENVVFLQDNLIVLNGVAIVATNGWWTWDFNPNVDFEQSQMWFCDHYGAPRHTAQEITVRALSDARFLSQSIERLQLYPDVKKIIVVTHTVPRFDLVRHSTDLVESLRVNTLGNSLVTTCLEQDLERKVSHWCFGHFHSAVDQVIDGVRYVNNCRGRGDTPWRQLVYHPLKIEIRF
jgi:predicted phosphodiesterase